VKLFTFLPFLAYSVDHSPKLRLPAARVQKSMFTISKGYFVVRERAYHLRYGMKNKGEKEDKEKARKKEEEEEEE